MGVKGLAKLLSDLPGEVCQRYQTMYDVIDRNPDIKVIAIDANLYGYKYAISTGDAVAGFLNQSFSLLKKGVLPIYVLDDFQSYPPAKQATQAKRARRSKSPKTKFDKQAVESLKQVMDAAGIPVVCSPCEADGMCALLCKEGVADACLTDDLDVLVLGSPKVIRKEGEAYTIYDHERALHALGVGPEELLKLAVILGCDYSRGISRIRRLPAAAVLPHLRIFSSIPSQAHQHLWDGFEAFRSSADVAASDMNRVSEKLSDALTHLVPDPHRLESKVKELIGSGRHPCLRSLALSKLHATVRLRNQITSLMIGGQTQVHVSERSNRVLDQ